MDQEKWHFIGELRVIVIGPFSLGQVSSITRGLVSTPGAAPEWEFGASGHSGPSPKWEVEGKKGPVEVLIVDHAEKASAN
jgi:hypothetical protein